MKLNKFYFSINGYTFSNNYWKQYGNLAYDIRDEMNKSLLTAFFCVNVCIDMTGALQSLFNL